MSLDLLVAALISLSKQYIATLADKATTSTVEETIRLAKKAWESIKRRFAVTRSEAVVNSL